jgi:hypothetical protein
MEKKLALLFILFFSYTGIAQIKYEKEERVKKEELPTPTVKLLSLVEANSRRIRYFREINDDNLSYEIKLKKNSVHYSIEFSQEGVLQDIEVLIKKSELPMVVLEAAKNHFRKIKFIRIQKQFSHTDNISPSSTLQKVFKNKVSPEAYEIVVLGKTQNGYRYFELLLDTEGTLLKKSHIITKDSENVVY